MPPKGRSSLQVSICVLLSAVAWQSPAQASGRLHNQRQVEAGVPYNGFIVRFKDGSTQQAQAGAVLAALGVLNQRIGAVKLLGPAPLASTGGFVLRHGRRMANGADVIRLSRKLARSEGVVLMRELAAMPNVDYVEPNLRVSAALVPNDPAYPSAWALSNPLTGVNPQHAWDLAQGAGVTVAVLDTGITNHADLSANVVRGHDFVSDPVIANDGNARDSNASDPGDWCVSTGEPSTWHGTHVAGIIAALGNNGVLMTGLAPAAKVMPVRVLGACGGDIADLSDAITWASGGSVVNVATLPATKVAKVINLSLTAPGQCSESLQQAVAGALRRGAVLVAAAGNDNADVSTVQPANCGGVIAVAAHTEDGFLATFSNHGQGVHLTAPGQNIVSAWNLGRTAPDPGTQTLHALSGTSTATPHVAAVAALVQSHRLSHGQPRLRPGELASVLTDNTRPLPYACPQGCGAGMLDAERPMRAALTVGSPALLGVGNDGRTYTQQHLGAPWRGVPGTVPMASAALSSTLGPVGIGANGRLYARSTLEAGDWQVQRNFNNVAMLSLASMPDGTLLGVGFSKSLYTRASLTAPWVLVPNSAGVDSAAMLPDGSIVAVSSGDRTLRMRASLASPWVPVPGPGGLRSVAALSNGSIVGLGSDGRLYQRPSLSAPWLTLEETTTISHIASMIY